MALRLAKFAAAAGCLLLATASAQQIPGFVIKKPLKVGEKEPFSATFAVGQAETQEHVISYPNAEYISVHFSEFNLPEGDIVVVHSPDMSTSYEYKQLGRGNLGKSPEGFYTPTIPGNTAIVKYVSMNGMAAHLANSGFGYKIDGFMRGINNFTPLSICGKDNSYPAKCYVKGNNSLPVAYDKAQAVARLILAGGSLCTGWLVGNEGHLITNNHCISTQSQAAQLQVELGAESDSCGNECKVRLGCKGKIVSTTSELIATSDERDYALVKLPAGTDLSAFTRLFLRETGPLLGEKIYIPQHPAGWAKRIASIDDNQKPTVVTYLNGTTSCGSDQVGYLADTQGGSSGSPVLSVEDNSVVALHHCGGCENTAVNIADVVADLKKQNVDVSKFLASSQQQ